MLLIFCFERAYRCIYIRTSRSNFARLNYDTPHSGKSSYIFNLTFLCRLVHSFTHFLILSTHIAHTLTLTRSLSPFWEYVCQRLCTYFSFLSGSVQTPWILIPAVVSHGNFRFIRAHGVCMCAEKFNQFSCLIYRSHKSVLFIYFAAKFLLLLFVALTMDRQ